MRRAAAIGMLVLHVGLFTEMKELLRLPILVEHYLEHRSQVPEMSFFQFLGMHYKTDVAHDSTDMELPFKRCEHSVTIPTFTIAEQGFDLVPVNSEEPRKFYSAYVSLVPSRGLDEIFQPPRA